MLNVMSGSVVQSFSLHRRITKLLLLLCIVVKMATKSY